MSSLSARVVALFGLPIDDVSMTDAVCRIETFIQSGRSHQIATANLDFVRNARKSAELQRVICDCSMVLPDGAPMLLGSRLLRRPLKERVTGVDLVPHLAKLSSEKGYRIFVLGSTDENAQAAMAALRREYPGVNFAGQYAPAVAPLEQMNDAEILSRIHAAKPDILLVALGNPKQELWLARNRQLLQVPVAIGIGGSLEMIGGSVKRAPRWMQALHFEWMYRLLQEPQRLIPRYASDLAALLRYLPAEIVTNFMQPRSLMLHGFDVYETETMYILATPSTLTGYACNWLARQVRLSNDQKKAIVVDMTSTSRIEADGVGCLLHLRRVLALEGQQMYLTGVSGAVHRVFRTASLNGIFQMTLADGHWKSHGFAAPENALLNTAHSVLEQ